MDIDPLWERMVAHPDTNPETLIERLEGEAELLWLGKGVNRADLTPLDEILRIHGRRLDLDTFRQLYVTLHTH